MGSKKTTKLGKEEREGKKRKATSEERFFEVFEIILNYNGDFEWFGNFNEDVAVRKFHIEDIGLNSLDKWLLELKVQGLLMYYWRRAGMYTEELIPMENDDHVMDMALAGAQETHRGSALCSRRDGGSLCSLERHMDRGSLEISAELKWVMKKTDVTKRNEKFKKRVYFFCLDAETMKPIKSGKRTRKNLCKIRIKNWVDGV
ncbi:uncharacterized protein LOC126678686 [Mercurialis annua]|uniref:uncharacterized protein LOC126678686 n=1 Tax=Mercurialis annua TaxID=3986 RepID=UPI00215FF5BD|nr:uncharacterized protein LOC126678686 [Mercurialis annua]